MIKIFKRPSVKWVFFRLATTALSISGNIYRQVDGKLICSISEKTITLV